MALVRCVYRYWARERDGTYYIFTVSTQHDAAPEGASHMNNTLIRAIIPQAVWIIKPANSWNAGDYEDGWCPLCIFPIFAGPRAVYLLCQVATLTITNIPDSTVPLFKADLFSTPWFPACHGVCVRARVCVLQQHNPPVT